MKEKNKYLIKNFGVFAIGSFGSKILAFLLVPLYTTVLNTDDYGSVDIVVSTVSLLAPILLLSVFDAVLRFGMDPDYRNEDVLSTAFNIALKGNMLLIFFSLLLGGVRAFGISKEYLIFLCAYFMIDTFNQIFNLHLKTVNKATIIAVGGIANTFISCMLNVLLLLVFKWGIVGYMVSNTLGGLVQLLYQLWFGEIYKDIKIYGYKNLSKPMLTYSYPLIPNSISLWLNNACDRYILTLFTSMAEIGVYSIAYKIPTILAMFQGIYYNAWSISAIKEFDTDDTDGFIGNNYVMYSLISLLVCSSLLIINVPLAGFLYQGDYFRAWQCVPFLLMGTVFSGISQFEGSLFAATKKTKIVAKTTIIGAAVNVVLNFIFIYFIGIIGAALATFIGYMITWWLRTKYLMSFVKMSVDWKVHFISIAVVSIQSTVATIGAEAWLQVILFLLLIMLNRKIVVLGVRKFI